MSAVETRYGGEAGGTRLAPAARPGAAGRRQELILAARSLIAERGMEGLRTRDVASRAGVNIATLHYYFATKADLIAGVVADLAEQFRRVHAPRADGGAGTPLERLRREFADIRFYQAERSELWLAINELSLRALRDPAIAAILHDLEQHWLAGLRAILADGVADGTFRADLDPDAAAAILLGFFRGSRLPTLDPPGFDRARTAFERWLLAPRGARELIPDEAAATPARETA